eukprot:938775-Amphidinium_carterae.3
MPISLDTACRCARRKIWTPLAFACDKWAMGRHGFDVRTSSTWAIQIGLTKQLLCAEQLEQITPPPGTEPIKANPFWHWLLYLDRCQRCL